MPQVKAHARYIRISPRKVRVVADAVRGMTAKDALDQLNFISAKASKPLGKVIRSAIANAEHNSSMDKDSLKINSLTVDGGPIFKRYRARAFGRAHPIQKKTSHITVILEGTKLDSSKQSPRADQKDTSSSVESQKPKKDTEEDVYQKPIQPLDKQDFKVEKKVGKERKTPFTRKIFRRKSI